ncbi:MAG: SAM-dependent methyltransferase [Candidatus Delongbacteria bacterium]
MAKFIFTCSSGYENSLSDELTAKGFRILEILPGSVLSVKDDDKTGNIDDYCFPHFCMIKPQLIEGTTVNGLGKDIAERFFNMNRNTKFENSWHFMSAFDPEVKGLGKRESAVCERALVDLKRIAGKVARLSQRTLPAQPGRHDGLFLYFADFGKVWLSTEFIWFGQRRVSDDPAAPSRSYLKIEEAYRAFGCEPESGETVCDLGAAPGGWSYSAAKRGARVTAVDNGELKAGAKGNANITRLAADAFTFVPDKKYDWLFCDMVEHPNMVTKLLEKWIKNKWSRKFIVNLKFGRVDPIQLLEKLNSPELILKKRCLKFGIKHLYHDRDEITVFGILE